MAGVAFDHAVLHPIMRACVRNDRRSLITWRLVRTLRSS